VLSRYVDQPYASWVSMLDARSGALLRITPVGHRARQLLLDDATHHVLVLAGGAGSERPAPLQLLVLDTATGRLLRTIDLGPGEVQQAALEGQRGWLCAVITPGQASMEISAGVLRIIDTRTGKPVHTLSLNRGDTAFVIAQTAGRLFVLNSAGMVRIFRTDSWTMIAATRVREPQFGVADEVQGMVAIVTGTQRATIAFLHATTGAVVAAQTVAPAAPIATLVLDNRTDHAFVVGSGTASSWEQATDYGVALLGSQDGAVAIVDRTTGAILSETPVGIGAVRAAVDAKSQHLFVLSFNHVSGSAGRVGGYSSDDVAPAAVSSTHTCPGFSRIESTVTSTLVSMLATNTGALLRATTIPLTDVLNLADLVVDARVGRAYVNAVGGAGAQGARHNNTVLLLDTHSGSVVRTVELPRLANSSW
jgi:hypothetical protein